MAENISNDEPRPTGLQKSYPILIDNVEFKYFKTWNTTRNDYVTTHETEGGTQEDVTTRRGRRSIGVTVTCLQPLLAQLLAIADKDEFSVKFYEPAIDDYVTIQARVGAGTMTYSLKEGSADLEAVDGVWVVSFTLEEF